MSPTLPPYLTRSSRGQKRRPARRRRWAVALFAVLAAAVAVVLAFTLLGGKKPTESTTTSPERASSTSTSANQMSSSSTTSTTLGASTTTPATPATSPQTYSAVLSGQNEIPAIATSAGGTLTLTMATDGSSMGYVFNVTNISRLTVARLHEGKAGAMGSTILTIYGGPRRTDVFSGVVTQGSFTTAQLGGSLRGKTLADLVDLIKAGSVYFNVGTTSHPLGEIRGQLK